MKALQSAGASFYLHTSSYADRHPEKKSKKNQATNASTDVMETQRVILYVKARQNALDAARDGNAYLYVFVLSCAYMRGKVANGRFDQGQRARSNVGAHEATRRAREGFRRGVYGVRCA